MRQEESVSGFTDPSIHRQCWEHSRNFIQHEDNLIDHRLTWLATSQTIFFAGYVLQFTAMAPSSPPRFLKWGIPLFGIISCLLIYASILAALIAWGNAHRSYLGHIETGSADEADVSAVRDVSACARFQLPLTPGTRRTDVLGYLSPRALPILFLLGWIALLVAG